MQRIKNYVGIDISKLTFDVAIENEGQYRYYKLNNDIAGFEQLLDLLPPGSQVVMEASGPYYLRLAVHLHEQNVAVSVINPLVIRRFCQMRMSRTKTDKKDAGMIASYGKTEHPCTWHPQEGYVMELGQLQTSTSLLEKSRTSFIRQLEAFDQLPVISVEAITAINNAITVIEKQLAAIDLRMQELIKQYHGQMYEQVQSIPGVGKKTALLLIVLSGGFTKFKKARQLSSYIGICPRIFESGSSIKGKGRITKMGMSKIRSMLYMCTWSARKCNKACRELYDRLIAQGKAKKLALIAVANKLLKQAFAIATQNVTFNPNL